jgi:hypothetical protein
LRSGHGTSRRGAEVSLEHDMRDDHDPARHGLRGQHGQRRVPWQARNYHDSGGSSRPPRRDGSSSSLTAAAPPPLSLHSILLFPHRGSSSPSPPRYLIFPFAAARFGGVAGESIPSIPPQQHRACRICCAGIRFPHDRQPTRPSSAAKPSLALPRTFTRHTELNIKSTSRYQSQTNLQQCDIILRPQRHLSHHSPQHGPHINPPGKSSTLR